MTPNVLCTVLGAGPLASVIFPPAVYLIQAVPGFAQRQQEGAQSAETGSSVCAC